MTSVCVSVFLCVGVLVCTCVRVCVHACVIIDVESRGPMLDSLPHFMRQGLSLNLGLPDLGRLSGEQALEIPPPHLHLHS